jgi:hypothetical protein
LGDPLEVIRSPKQVVVTGVGIEPSRRAEIARILETMPRVATRFDEPAAGAALPLRTTVRRPSMSEPLLRLQARLEKHVGGRPSFERFSDHLLESVDTMMAHAHALRRLAERFPQRVEESLTEHEQPVLDRLRTEHRNAIRREVGGIEASLAPALRSIGAQSQPFSLSSQSPDWQSNAERLLEAARELERLMAGVLGGAVLEDSRLEAELPSHLLTSIERMLAESGRESTQ